MHIRPFEIAFIGFFAVAALAGVFFLSTHNGVGDPEDQRFGERVVIWGTLNRSNFERILTDLGSVEEAIDVVQYVQIDARNFEDTLVNAIAEGRSPDLVILPHELLVSERAKLKPISYNEDEGGISVRTFRDTYVDGAEIFMRSDGIYGIPFAVDPLIMYWNRDLFSSSGLSAPPKTWETLVGETTKAITRVNDRREITQSAVAFGEYSNVSHAKDILAMLFLQAGSSLVDEQDGRYRVTMNKSNANSLATGSAVLFFYTQFAIPSQNLYSWNRSRALDRSEFLGGTLALYFGKGSEYASLERENPNLNFDVAQVPQGSDVTVFRNYGDFYAFAIPRATQNPNGAYALARFLGSPENAEVIARAYNLSPVHRSTLTEGSDEPIQDVLYRSALISRGWLDPNPTESSRLFKSMVEEIVANNNQRINDVVDDIIYQLESLF